MKFIPSIIISLVLAFTPSCSTTGSKPFVHISTSYAVAKVIQNSSPAKREKRIADIREASYALEEFGNGKLPRASLDLLLNKLLSGAGEPELVALRSLIDGYLPAGQQVLNPEHDVAIGIRELARIIRNALPVEATK